MKDKSPFIVLETCTIGTERRCFSVKLTRKLFWIIIMLYALSVLASGIYGAAISPFTGLGLSYAAYHIGLNALVLAMLIPVVGLIIGIGFFGAWTTLAQANLGIVPDFWILSITTAAFWIGIVLQVFLLIYVFWTLITKNRMQNA